MRDSIRFLKFAKDEDTQLLNDLHLAVLDWIHGHPEEFEQFMELENENAYGSVRALLEGGMCAWQQKINEKKEGWF